MEGYAKGDGAPRGFGQGTMKIIEKDEHEISNTQAFIPTPSNDEEVKDVSLREMFDNTPKEGTNISSLTAKSVSCKLPKVFRKVPSRKWALIGNANYLVKAMNKFAKGSINANRHKLEFGERMTTLLIKSDEKLVIKQMKFELESWKLELEHAQAKTTQLAIAKMIGDILHASKWFKYLLVCDFV